VRPSVVAGESALTRLGELGELAELAEHPLWRPITAWAFALHADSRVADTCVRLQDEHGLDVCVLLACAWYGVERRRELSLERVRELRRAVEPIAGWIARLRVLRRELAQSARDDPDRRRLYASTKATELEAEILELSCLHAALAIESPGDTVGETDPRRAAEASLRRYAELQAAVGAEPLLAALVAALPEPSAAGSPRAPEDDPPH
jgi:uncharacterized protein (TIGR02444 family)